MGAKEFVMPKLAMGMNEGTVQEWLVQEGEFVAQGQQIASMETEKVAYELEAPEPGYYKPIVDGGTTVPVETPIAYYADSVDALAGIGAAVFTDEPSPDASATKDAVTAPATAECAEAGQGAPVSVTPGPAVATAPAQAAQTDGRVKASPLARKMAQSKGLDIALIQGSGPEGRVVKRDILRAETTGEGKPQAASGGMSEGLVEQARIPMSGMRHAIANAMMDKINHTATLTQFNEADVTELLAARQRLVEKEELLGTKVSVNAFFIKAIAWAAKRVPIVNSSLQGEEIVVWDNVNVAIALALPSGDGYTENLLVPVIKHVDRLSLVDIDRDLKRLINLGREGKMTAADMADNTITFSTTAGIAPNGTSGNSILNGNNNAIVGIGGAKFKPAEYRGELALRQLAPVCVNYDHRVIDGAPASRFMNYLYLALEDPTLLLA